MHAAIGIFHHDPSRWSSQRSELDERIIPFVKQSPGFIRGAWSYDRATSRSYSYIVFDDETSARAFVAAVKAQSEMQTKAGVTLESFVNVEVIAETTKD